MILKYFMLLGLMLISLGVSSQEDIRMSEEDIAYQDKFIEAKGYILLDKPEKSEDLLVSLYREDRTNVAVALELATLYDKLDDPANRHRYAKVAADNASDNVYVLDKYGLVCLDIGKYDEAASAYKRALVLKPESEEYTDKLATALMKEGSYLAAIDAYNDLQALIGISQDVTRRKFELYDLIGERQKAIEELEALISAQPKNLEALHTLAKYYNKIGDEKNSKQTYQKILAVDINDTKANIELMGDADAPEHDDNYLRALSPIIENKDIPLDNKVLELMQFVQKYANTGDPALGSALTEVAQTVVANYPSEAKSHALLGDVLFLSGKYGDAIKSYEKTLTINDNVYPVWEQLMYALVEVKDYPSLLERSHTAVDLFPNKATAFLFQGIALKEEGNYEEAISYLEEGQLIAGKNHHLKSDILTELASTLLLVNKLDKAEKTIDKALNYSDSKNPTALEVKGDILADKGDGKLAQKYWTMAKNAGSTSETLIQKLK